jgi:hypothetical protein
MEPAAAVTILAVVLIILALVVYLVAVILELRKITSALDVVIGAVGEIVSKSAQEASCSRVCSRRRQARRTPPAWSNRSSPEEALRCSSARDGRAR